MYWFAAVIYAVLSALVGLLIGRGIRVREEERPAPAEDAATPTAEPEMDPLLAVQVCSPDAAAVDVRAVRAFTGRTPRALRPQWQRTALRTLGL